MANLNYKHLKYFWTVARLGSIARASEQLHLTPQSISGQLGELESSLGVQLFRRVGRGLELTDTGREIYSYAENIFTLGNELLDVALAQSGKRLFAFRVGIADSVPKLLAYRVVEPALRGSQPIRLVCRDGQLASLLAEMAVHRLELVIADQPMPGNLNVRGYSHLIGESELAVFGAPALVKSLKGKFPQLLDGAPFLMPGAGVAIRPGLLRWFETSAVRPHVVAEIDDGALLKSFGQAGTGFFVAPLSIADSVCKQYGVRKVGHIHSVKEQLYAITTERRLKHPAILAVINTTQREVFGSSLHSQ